jgi:hypothetical protein
LRRFSAAPISSAATLLRQRRSTRDFDDRQQICIA